MTIAKQLSSAYLPIAGVLMTQPFYDTIADQSAKLGILGVGYTYSGHPAACAVAAEAVRIYEEDRILDHVREVAPRFQARVSRLQGKALVGEARSVGLIAGVELVRNKATREPFDAAVKAAAQVVQRCLAHGLILRPLPGDVIGICPPLIITGEEIDMLFDRLEQALDESVAGVPLAA